MTVIIDASVACKWFFEEDGSAEARALAVSLRQGYVPQEPGAAHGTGSALGREPVGQLVKVCRSGCPSRPPVISASRFRRSSRAVPARCPASRYPG